MLGQHFCQFCDVYTTIVAVANLLNLIHVSLSPGLFWTGDWNVYTFDMLHFDSLLSDLVNETDDTTSVSMPSKSLRFISKPTIRFSRSNPSPLHRPLAGIGQQVLQLPAFHLCIGFCQPWASRFYGRNVPPITPTWQQWSYRLSSRNV